VAERTATGETVVGDSIETLVVGATDVTVVLVLGTVCCVGPTTVVVVLGTVVVDVVVVEVVGAVVDVVEVEVVEVDVVEVEVVEVEVVEVDVVEVDVVGTIVVVVVDVGGQCSLPTPAEADVEITAAAHIVSTPKITKRPANLFTPVSIRLRHGGPTTRDRRQLWQRTLRRFKSKSTQRPCGHEGDRLRHRIQNSWETLTDALSP
jgi:hypothetical protein